MRLFPERTISLVEMRLYCPYGYVKAAGYLYILHAVTFTHEQYFTADLRKRVDCFPQFCLPLTSLGPVVSVSAFTYCHKKAEQGKLAQLCYSFVEGCQRSGNRFL